MNFRTAFIFLFLNFFIISISSCEKENNNAITLLSVRLTDNPFAATAVNIDIKGIDVNMNDNSTDWIALSTKSGIYNLLNYQDGIDTLIANGPVPMGTLKEIRFKLGTANSITIADSTYLLTIPSGSESGLKLKTNQRLETMTAELLIDFDADLSIVKTGSGVYLLQPVLKLKSTAK